MGTLVYNGTVVFLFLEQTEIRHHTPRSWRTAEFQALQK